MATHSSTLAWKIHGRRSLVGCSPWGCEEADTTERLHFHVSLSCIGGGNGNPVQCSCLENPRDGGAWWAAAYGVAQSRTWLKWFSSSSNSSRLWECETLRGLGLATNNVETKGSHWDSQVLVALVLRKSMYDFWNSQVVSKRFLSSFQTKGTINSGACCQGRGSDSVVFLCKSPNWLGMKETSVHPLFAMRSFPWLSKLMF